ncbi:MAG: TM2 domain-containing protein [Janthinobacterium lividum]
MKRTSALFVALGIAAASLSSCSRSNYAFNNTAPAYLGSEKVQAAASVAEPVATEAVITLPASATAQRPVVAHAAKAAVKPVVKAVAVAPAAVVTETPATDAITSTIAKTSYSHAERKALRHQVKQIIASHNSTTAEGKSQLVAAILCFFLGGIGIHDFYLGRPLKGVLQILLTLLFGVGFILVIIDFVRILLGTEKPADGDYAKKL